MLCTIAILTLLLNIFILRALVHFFCPRARKVIIFYPSRGTWAPTTLHLTKFVRQAKKQNKTNTNKQTKTKKSCLNLWLNYTRILLENHTIFCPNYIWGGGEHSAPYPPPPPVSYAYGKLTLLLWLGSKTFTCWSKELSCIINNNRHMYSYDHLKLVDWYRTDALAINFCCSIFCKAVHYSAIRMPRWKGRDILFLLGSGIKTGCLGDM